MLEEEMGCMLLLTKRLARKRKRRQQAKMALKQFIKTALVLPPALLEPLAENIKSVEKFIFESNKFTRHREESIEALNLIAQGFSLIL